MFVHWKPILKSFLFLKMVRRDVARYVLPPRETQRLYALSTEEGTI